MKIKHLHIENFRGFEKLDIDFPDSNLAVFIGANGAGKSSVLDGLAMALGEFVGQLFIQEIENGQRGMDNSLSLSSEDVNIKASRADIAIEVSSKNGNDKWFIAEISPPLPPGHLDISTLTDNIGLATEWRNELHGSSGDINLPLLILRQKVSGQAAIAYLEKKKSRCLR